MKTALALFVVGLGGVLLVRFGVSRFVGVASSAARRVSQQPGNWMTRTPVRWAFAISGVAVLVILIPGEWRNPVLTNWNSWLVVGAIVGYVLLAHAVRPIGWDDRAKKRVIAIARLLLAVALLGIGSRFLDSKDWGDSQWLEKVSAKVDDLTKPAPPAPVVWKGEKIVTLQPGTNWIGVDIPWGGNHYHLETGPNPNSLAEVWSPEWDKAYLVGGEDRKSPFVPSDRKLLLRSKEEKPITVKVMWR